jgi:hypothetical protein
MDTTETQWDDLDWIHLAQEPVASSCDHGNEPLGSIICWKILE